MHNIYVYIIVMAAVTYLIRMLPLTLIRREIKSKFVKSFLYYVPYATLAAMTFPAILHASDNMIASVLGFAVALILAFRRKSLLTVAMCACAVVFVAEMFLIR
ncbi:MAG: AzlD domain-containing protein [Butyrivibrio sp.]|nr:AzlD domain-containing protein [Butyrivibrio sp.]